MPLLAKLQPVGPIQIKTDDPLRTQEHPCVFHVDLAPEVGGGAFSARLDLHAVSAIADGSDRTDVSATHRLLVGGLWYGVNLTGAWDRDAVARKWLGIKMK